MSILIAQKLAEEIALLIHDFINKVKVYFNDNTEKEIESIIKNQTHDSENKKYIVSFVFTLNLEEAKSIAKIEYYYDDGTERLLILSRDDLALNIGSGITAITHQISVSYQV